MKKEMFITKAVEFGATYQEAFWLESVYIKKDVTDKDKNLVIEFFEAGKHNQDLLELCKKYNHSNNPKITAEMVVENALVELDQLERDYEFSHDEKLKFKLKLISRLTEFIQEDLSDMPDF